MWELHPALYSDTWREENFLWIPSRPWTSNSQLPLPSSQGGRYITRYSRMTNVFRYKQLSGSRLCIRLTSSCPTCFFFISGSADLPQRVWTRSISSWPPDCQLHVHWPVTDCHIAPSRPTEPRGPPLWTPCLDLLHLLELFNSPPVHNDLSLIHLYPWPHYANPFGFRFCSRMSSSSLVDLVDITT